MRSVLLWGPFAEPPFPTNDRTTAYDLYLITKEAIKHEQFMNICNTEYVEIPATNVNPARSYYSSNALLTANGTYGSGYVYEYAAGVKTGFTQAAGYCLVSTAEKDGVRVLAIVLGGGGVLNTGASTYDNFADSVKLYNWVFDNFSYREVVSAADPLVKVTVQLAEGDGSANLRAAGNASLLLPNDVDETGRQLECTVYEDRLVADPEFLPKFAVELAKKWASDEPVVLSTPSACGFMAAAKAGTGSCAAVFWKGAAAGSGSGRKARCCLKGSPRRRFP